MHIFFPCFCFFKGFPFLSTLFCTYVLLLTLYCSATVLFFLSLSVFFICLNGKIYGYSSVNQELAVRVSGQFYSFSSMIYIVYFTELFIVLNLLSFSSCSSGWQKKLRKFSSCKMKFTGRDGEPSRIVMYMLWKVSLKWKKCRFHECSHL